MKDSLIYGTLLGDSWIFKNEKGDYVFSFSQKNKEYAKWKANILGYPYGEYNRKRYDIRTKKYYTNLTIVVKIPLSKRKRIYDKFYKPNKIVTTEILNKLTNKGICLWYLDDGSVYYNGNNCHISLSVDSFTDNERKLIINYFKKKFSIIFRVSRKSIRLVNRKDCELFMKKISRFIPKCMEYKKLSVAILKHKQK